MTELSLHELDLANWDYAFQRLTGKPVPRRLWAREANESERLQMMEAARSYYALNAVRIGDGWHDIGLD